MAQVQTPSVQPEPELTGFSDLKQLAQDLVAGTIDPVKAVSIMQQQKGNWRFRLTEEQRQLLNTCRLIKQNNLNGLPGHGLIMLVATLAEVLDEQDSSRPVK